MTIQAIFWDIGGVLVRTHDRTPRQQLAESLGMTYEALEELVWGGERGRQAQTGFIREEEQWAYACRVVGWSEKRAGELKDQFFAGDQVDDALADYVRSLRTRYLTGVISNAMSGARDFLIHSARIADAFTSLTYSYEVGVMKPEPPIYQAALQSLGVEAAQAVFVDDFQKNVSSAQALGMQAVHFRSPDQAINELEAILFSPA